MIRVQREDFDIGRELDRLAAGDRSIGGVASFVGLVRDMGGPERVSALTLEHYPGMTEKKLAEIEAEANRGHGPRPPDMTAGRQAHGNSLRWARRLASCLGPEAAKFENATFQP